MNLYRIILADDHAMFRQGIKRIVQEVEGLLVVGETGNGIELLRLIPRLAPDMVVLDISMPDLRGIEAAREIRQLHPHVKILILTMHKDMEYFHHAISAGVSGYLLKEDADEALLTAIRTIRQGKIYVSPLLAAEFPAHLARRSPSGQNLPDENLTTREKEVLKLIAEGKTSKEIGELFHISVRTVQHHRANLMRKLDINKTADLVKYAIRKGFTSVSSRIA